jgi:hypothetical protein
MIGTDDMSRTEEDIMEFASIRIITDDLPRLVGF